MSKTNTIADDETGFDRVLSFILAERHARGRVVRLGPVLDQILSAHDYPPPIRRQLAEALVLTALMGSLLADDGSQLTVQAQTEGGIVDLLACDYRNGELRGYIRHDAARLARLGKNPSLFALFGKGYLAITFDLATKGQRYQGIVPLEGDSLAEACQSYFVQSEQIPTLIRIGMHDTPNGTIAGGLVAQHLAEGDAEEGDGRERLHVRLDHPEWQHIAALAGSTKSEELTDSTLSLEALVWRLFHEENEVRVLRAGPISRGCRCTVEHYRDVLSRFPTEELAEMRGDDGFISVDCAFCSKKFPIDL